MSKESILGTLVIVVLKAQHLIDNHKFYKQDPYAKLSLSGASKQTPVDPKGGQHPVWDAELRFPISRDPSKSNRTLSVSVFSEEKKDDELLGEATVDIDETLKTGEFDDWVPLSLKGTQRGEVYLEMTFFSAGPSPLTRRPSKFTNPTERLARPQQPVAQRPQRVTSQPSSSNVTPHVQPSWSSSQDTSRQGRAKVVQVPLPGSWPGQSSQHQQPSQLAAPSNPNRRSPKDQDSALPPLPLDAVPKQEFVPAILRPGGPSGVPPGTTVLPSHEARSVPSDTPEQGRYRAGTSSPPFSNHVAPLATGYHSTTHSDLSSNAYHPPHLTHQDTLPLPVSLAPLAPQSHPHVHSSSPQLQPQPQPQPRARAISGQGPPGYDGYSSGVQAITQPSPQPHRELAYVNHNSQPQSPPQQQQQIQHSPPHQTQPPPSQSAPYVSSYPPSNQIPVHPYVASPDSLSPGQSYGATASPASPAHPYASTSSPTPPTQSHVLNPSPAPATHHIIQPRALLRPATHMWPLRALTHSPSLTR
ncbi:hypothetical protein B0F90DRAFT_1302076 [Multifurca ochricompacta]|uniref:C2 domain-containing protein n=1 Tax=Multifurca ochricompacta TaxID=376703 RepID=A0AAD4M8N2_9AGAM|nr:hypothetical protein B0F90DRAFT_1302076 [Multifurca ochricompacta]